MSELPAELGAPFDGLDEAARTARESLVHDLLASGHSADDLLAAHAGDRWALLPVTDVLREDGSRTFDDIAAAHGVDPAELAAVRRALGLSVTRTEWALADRLR